MKLISFIIPYKPLKYESYLPNVEIGFGNGYVMLPKNHPAYNKHYDSINIDVHGGLTFSELAINCVNNTLWPEEIRKLCRDNPEHWVVGFDTAHLFDSLVTFPESEVINETNRLKEQLESMF